MHGVPLMELRLYPKPDLDNANVGMQDTIYIVLHSVGLIHTNGVFY